jgi:hypothetical protein
MRSCRKLAASAFVLGVAFALPALAADNSVPAGNGERVDANGMPTTHSTPEEQAQTKALNTQVSSSNAAIEAQATQSSAVQNQQQQQYQQQKEQYEQQLQQNQAAQLQYQDQTAAYENLRARYAAERARYHRAVWPDRYSHWTLDESDPGLRGQRVEILNGDRVGTVIDVAHSPNGHVEALLVRLDGDKTVWIDQADVRYDRGDGVVMTNLDRTDLRQMADERL